MSQCPFHSDSTGISQDGEIESIRCSHCGEYRISRTALKELKQRRTPQGWLDMLAHRALISTRDVRALS
ncbi:MAG: hypothetical protein RIC89_02460 [Pseudomonadales bacterium]